MWPRPNTQGAPLQDEAARRILEDASQQLASGNPAQSLQTVLNLLSALHLPGEAAAVALRVQEAMAKDPSTDVTAQLASLLGSLTLSSGQSSTSHHPLPLPHMTSLQTDFQNNLHLFPPGTIDVDMDDTLPPPQQLLGSARLSPLSSSRNAVAITSSPADGEASYLCESCGSLISVARKEAHEHTWCPALQKHPPP